MEFEKTLRQTVDEYCLMAKKALGQNFLLDQNITDKIIHLSLLGQNMTDFKNADVFEIGPGPGGLTRAILKQYPQSLTVVEADERCCSIMQDLKAQTKCDMNIIQGDALKTDVAALGLKNVQIVSNLPYNISVPLLTGWLENLENIAAMTLMFQKEVADRILAPIKTKDYGRLSAMAQLNCKIEKLMTLNPECFVPAPKIYSSVLLFKPLSKRPEKEVMQKVAQLTQAAFAQRRKMIRQSLKSIPNIEKICLAAEVPMTARAEEISPEQYLMMAQSGLF